MPANDSGWQAGAGPIATFLGSIIVLVMAFRIEFTPEAAEHVGRLRAHDRRRLLDAVQRQLEHQPDVITRNRGPLRPNPLAAFRLRVGHLRAYYDVHLEAGLVIIKAVGIKRHARVIVAGLEIEL